MLISVCQGTFNGASACLWHCNTNCKLHSDEGHGRLPFLLSRAVCVRSLRSLLFVRDAAKGALFAFVRCYCLRVGALVCACTLFEAVFLPFARLFLLLQYFAHLARFRAFMWLFLQPRLQPILCSLRSEIQRLGGAKIGSSGTSPPPPWVRFIVFGVLQRPAAISLQ